MIEKNSFQNRKIMANIIVALNGSNVPAHLLQEQTKTTPPNYTIDSA